MSGNYRIFEFDSYPVWSPCHAVPGHVLTALTLCTATTLDPVVASYHVGAVSMIFLVFVSTSAMMIMACTMTCRCWLDSDPDKQAMMMVLSGGTPMVGCVGAKAINRRFYRSSFPLATNGTPHV